MSRQQAGVAVLEFVLSLPIFIVCLLSLLYYGAAFAIYRTGIDAAYVGAEAAATEPLLGRVDPTRSSAPRDAARRVAADYAKVRPGSGADAKACLTPDPGVVAANDNTYRYAVAIDFTACRILQGLSVELPFVGRLPPPPGNVTVSASVTL
jgi:Flp pilus assembly protein TadG